MRNLLGRLNARTPDELSAIADFWQTPLVGRDRLSQISQLYRAMTRAPMVRAQWDALDESGRHVITTLIGTGDDGATVPQLAERVSLSEETVREVCLRLYDAGLIAYEGTARTLSIGESPRLYVPTELAATVQQILAEARRGDISQRPLPELLALRAETEIFEAASLWGIEYIPGITTRTEAEQALIRRLTNGQVRSEHIGKLGHDVRLIWERLSAVPPGTPVALDQIVGAGNQRTMFNRRSAVNELEDLLLAWSMTLDDGVRALVVPVDFGTVEARSDPEAPRPKPVSLIGQVTVFRPPMPIAWDLMVLLQRLAGPLAPPNLDLLVLSDADAGEFNAAIWNRGQQRPPVGYVELLLELAVGLHLLEEPQEGSGQFERTDDVREWRLRTWDEQASRIRRIWMASPFWIDGQGRTEIEPWNVDWRGFRIKLLNHLATLETGQWFRAKELAEWIVAYDPGILGAGATVALSHAADPENRSEHVRSLAYLVESQMTRVLFWMGLVDCMTPPSGEPLITIRQTLRDLVRAEPARSEASTRKPVLSIADDLTVRISDPEPIQIWSLLAFAETVALGAESIFRITSERVRVAQSAGSRPEQIVQYLRRQQPVAIPEDFDHRIVDLIEQANGVELTAAVVIDAGQDAIRRDAQAVLETNGYVLSTVGTRLYVTIGTLRQAKVDVERIRALLESAGIGPIGNRSRI